MLISIYRELKKTGNEIEETFLVSPKHKLLWDTSREVSHFIALFILEQSINYPLKRTERGEGWKKHYYDWDESAKGLSKSSSWSFKYIPFNGKKTCNKCIHIRKIKDTIYCNGRMKKIKNGYWKDCLYWQENSIIQRTQ